MNPEGVLLYCGGDASTVQRRRCHLVGRRCFSGAYGPGSRFPADLVPQVIGLLDSGAFSDSPEDRLDPERSLQRQFRWEQNATRFWGYPWQCEALVSYDLLIDEKWTGHQRRKQRWDMSEADRAVRITVDAAAWMARQRERLAPRKLVLAIQGVDAIQYLECAQGVLAQAAPSDWAGLGGWCILGSHTSWYPIFWTAMRQVVPLIASRGITQVHLFGVMHRPALGGLLWLCDQHGLTLSTDSSGPVLGPTWGNPRKAGVLADTWEVNVAMWQDRLRTLRDSPFYHEPPDPQRGRQLSLFTE